MSRPARRAGGWGIPVPGDPGQVIYVWFDALCNYVTALGYPATEDYRRWWSGPGDRVHLLGKGVLRFHAVYWPAMLLSSGQPLPTDVFVHDYLTADGRKISKSGGGDRLDPAALAAAYGADAVRWWLLREVPRVGDADFTVGRLVARADDELANGLGNLVNRVVAMIDRYRGGRVPGVAGPGAAAPGGERLAQACREANAAAGAAWRTSTSAGPRPRSGASSTRRTPSSTGPAPGSWPGPNGTGPGRGRTARRGARPAARGLFGARPGAGPVPAGPGRARRRSVHTGR